MTLSLSGKTALVTGAGSGIGLACAEGLARAGANVILWGRRNLDSVRERISASGVDVTTIECDLGDRERTGETIATVLAEHQVDILLNNAGIIRRSPAVDYAWDDWRTVLSVNLDSVFQLSQAVGAQMIKRGAGGRIITIGSLLSFQGGVFVPAYTASKHGVAGLTKALANEWARHGITVNAIAPGYIATANTHEIRADAERELQIRSRIPAERWGTPEDIVGPAVFLAGPDAAYVNGHVLAVDGGWLAR